jgi:regulator of sigma E protease
VVSVKELLESPGFMSPRYPFVVDKIVEGGGAMEAGLLPGDRLVSLDGRPMEYFDQYQKELLGYKGGSVKIEIGRDSAGVALNKTFDVKVSGEGMIGASVDMLSVTPVHTREYTFMQSIPAGVRRVGTEIGGYWQQLKLLVNPKTEAYKTVASPLGIGNIFPGDWDWYSFWSITAMLSIVLAIMNILPIPALDGGHVLFLLVEMVTGRRPSDRFIIYAQVAGMAILLVIMIYAVGNDIHRLFIK